MEQIIQQLYVKMEQQQQTIIELQKQIQQLTNLTLANSPIVSPEVRQEAANAYIQMELEKQNELPGDMIR